MCARSLLHGFSSAWVIDSEKLSDLFVHVSIEAYSTRIDRHKGLCESGVCPHYCTSEAYEQYFPELMLFSAKALGFLGAPCNLHRRARDRGRASYSRRSCSRPEGRGPQINDGRNVTYVVRNQDIINATYIAFD